MIKVKLSKHGVIFEQSTYKNYVILKKKTEQLSEEALRLLDHLRSV